MNNKTSADQNYKLRYETWEEMSTFTNLLRGEGRAERADGLSILRRLLLDLQQLSRLDDRLQRCSSFTLEKVVGSEPLLQLTRIVPDPETNRTRF